MTLKNMLASLLVAATSDLLAEARPINTVCIKHTPLLGFQEDYNPVSMQLAGDIHNLSTLPINILAYSRPAKITICSD